MWLRRRASKWKDNIKRESMDERCGMAATGSGYGLMNVVINLRVPYKGVVDDDRLSHSPSYFDIVCTVHRIAMCI